MGSPFNIILGSSSSSRKQILSDMGYDFTVISADIDEREIRREKPDDLVMALAEAKADAIIERLNISDFRKDDSVPTLLITADQISTRYYSESELGCSITIQKLALGTKSFKVVVHDGTIREKPSDAEEARKFIKGYSDGHTSTVGSVLVTNLKTSTRKGGCDKAEIYFHKIPDEIIENLIKEGDVLYVAGGLMVEHPLTSPFVEAIVGTIDSVMGLPKALTEKLIKDALE